MSFNKVLVNIRGNDPLMSIYAQHASIDQSACLSNTEKTISGAAGQVFMKSKNLFTKKRINKQFQFGLTCNAKLCLLNTSQFNHTCDEDNLTGKF